jgi:hypothetical protein
MCLYVMYWFYWLDLQQRFISAINEHPINYVYKIV